MKILYVGTLVPAEYSLEIQHNSLAGNKLQVNLINEFRKKAEIDIISFVCVPLTLEQQKKLDKYNENSTDKYYYKGNNFIKNLHEFRKQIKKISKNYDAVMTFNVDYPWINLPNLSKTKNSILILSDFSDVNSYNNVLLKAYAKLCKNNFKKYDLVIGLSKNHKKYLTKNQKFVYMPGGSKLDSFQKVKPVKESKKIKVMYSGYLGKVTGIDMLIEAFKNEKLNNAELIITGRGDLEEDIKLKSVGNIKYLGSLEEDKYIDTLNSAHILVNPRNMNMPENENNFPSKIFDYLAVGKVLVSTKFSGYEDFKENFYFCESNINSIRKTLLKAIKEYPDTYKKQFKINTQKVKEYSWDKQVEKILEKIENNKID